MKNKFIIMLLIITFLFVCSDSNAFAYEFIKSENKNDVNNMVQEIYDAKEQYEDLVGEYSKTEEVFQTASNLYWWPIGSAETTEKNGIIYATGNPFSISISSYYGGTDGFRTSAHGGIDITPNGAGVGVVNVIASKSGEVVYPSSKSQTTYSDNGYYGSKDGGGYGNYVKIKHSDGTYTIYAHMAKDSITVIAGDVVEQGQVIGKIGTSGSSTGAHLHFEMRIGSDGKENRTDPLGYVNPNNPRPMSYSSGGNFSLIATNLTKDEFISKMQNFYDRTGKAGFKNNFLSQASNIYDTSVNNGVNPELVVVVAGTEQSWELSAECKYTNNYWGIGISNGEGCNSGGKYSSLSEGIVAYARLLKQYSDGGKFASLISSKNTARASCDTSGHGLPGTLEGMQSIYSSIGTYRYNPGSWGKGGCKYLNIIYGVSYCSTVPTCVSDSNCTPAAATTVCEQNDYTAWQVKKKIQMRYDIFGI